MDNGLMGVLDELLRKVPDSYPDFVLGSKVFLEEDGEEVTKEVINFMQENPNATTSEIIAFHRTLVPEDDIIFVDDDELDE